MAQVIFEVEYGVMVRVPVWSRRKGARNWAATIELGAPLNRSIGGDGVRRTWWKKVGHTPGRYYRVPEDIRLGTPVEFGTNPPKGEPFGQTNQRRFVGFVSGVDAESISFMKTEDAHAAVHLGAMLQRRLAEQAAIANKPRPMILDPDWND